jgi:DNA-binding LacI/PurR family transcriptional regulator
MSVLTPIRGHEGSLPGEPLYRQVERHIEHVIRHRGLEPGDAIPSLTELARELGVNGLTVRRAIQELAARDVVVTQQGRGTFVSLGAQRRILWVSSVNLFKSESSPYYTELLNAAHHACKAHGLRVEPVWIANDRPEDAQRYLNTTSLRSYAGYFLCACKPDHLVRNYVSQARLPHVNISQVGEQAAWTVAADIAQGNNLAIEQLARQGCRKIAVLSYGQGQMTDLSTVAQKYQLDLTCRSITPDQPRLAEVERLSLECVSELLLSGQSFDGWYFMDDILARGATRAMLMHGLASAPPVIVIRTGMEQSFAHGLPVQYVAFSIAEQAEMATRILLDQIESKPGLTRFLSSFVWVDTGLPSRSAT